MRADCAPTLGGGRPGDRAGDRAGGRPGGFRGRAPGFPGWPGGRAGARAGGRPVTPGGMHKGAIEIEWQALSHAAVAARVESTTPHKD